MSEWHVQVVNVGKIEKHPNADTLDIAYLFADPAVPGSGYPVIVRTGEFRPGEKAIYVPVDSLVPAGRIVKTDDGREYCEPNPGPFAFLWHEDRPRVRERIKAKRLRGIFSMGLLVKLTCTCRDPGIGDGVDPNCEYFLPVGADVHERLDIEKYEPPLPLTTGGKNEKDPGFLPVYTDIEGFRRWPGIIREGEEVVLTEKIHGANARFVYHNDRLWVGSHHNIKREDQNNLWWRAAYEHDLASKLARIPGIAVYGEAYGQVQDLKYGVKSGVRLTFFDAMDIQTRRYLDYDEFVRVLAEVDLPTVPVLYRGPWTTALTAMAEGNSTMTGASNIREGFVVRPVKERWDPSIQRVILKYVGQGYLLR